MELREFLKEHNMGITTLAKLIGVSRETIRRWEGNPEKCNTGSRRKIELALKMIRDEGLVRPALSRSIICENIDASFCAREAHLRDVIRFEREFKKRFREYVGNEK